MIKTIFFQNEYICNKDLNFIFNTNIFCVKIYFWNEIYVFYIFIYIFLRKIIFFTKYFFHYKTFLPNKSTANNVYFIKNKYFFKKKIIFFQLSFATNEQSYSSTVSTIYIVAKIRLRCGFLHVTCQIIFEQRTLSDDSMVWERELFELLNGTYLQNKKVFFAHFVNNIFKSSFRFNEM